MMYFSIIIGLIIVGIVIDNWSEMLGAIIVISFGVLLLVSVVSVPLAQMQGNSKVAEYKAFTETLDNSRHKDLSEIERANITSKIGEWNEKIAEARYYNDGIFSPFVSNKLAELDYIK